MIAEISASPSAHATSRMHPGCHVSAVLEMENGRGRKCTEGSAGRLINSPRLCIEVAARVCQSLDSVQGAVVSLSWLALWHLTLLDVQKLLLVRGLPFLLLESLRIDSEVQRDRACRDAQGVASFAVKGSHQNSKDKSSYFEAQAFKG